MCHSLIAMHRFRTVIACVCILAAAARSGGSRLTYFNKGNDLCARGKYEEASLAYRKAIQKDVRFGDAHYRLALAEIARGEPDKAIMPLRRAASLMPRHVDCRVKLADIYL